MLKAKELKIETITDIELAYRIRPTDKIIAITGTNGKTTTTALVGQIFNNANFKTHLGGNIGVGILWDMINSSEEDVFIIETSSFQLNDTREFKPKVSLITNITPDHLDWHGNLESYIEAKEKVFVNQDENDFTVLNYDDPRLRNIREKINSKIIYFSASQILNQGVFVEDNFIWIKYINETIKVFDTRLLKILGKHNLENALASVAIAFAMDIPVEIIRKTLEEFKGVDHRIEFVKELKGISFYNDSTGTNSDSTIKAIEAFQGPIILIAGGYNKGGDFDQLIKAFNGKVKDLILLGQTRDLIREAAINNGFNKIHMVENMEEAVNLAYSLANSKDIVLLSPACASWGMYNNFEERGKDFKNLVYRLR